QRGAHPEQVDVDLRRLAQGVLDRADGRDLAAEMEVQQLEAIEQLVLAQVVDSAQQVAAGEAELRAVAAGRLPVAGPTGGETGADAETRPHSGLAGDLAD